MLPTVIASQSANAMSVEVELVHAANVIVAVFTPTAGGTPAVNAAAVQLPPTDCRAYPPYVASVIEDPVDVAVGMVVVISAKYEPATADQVACPFAWFTAFCSAYVLKPDPPAMQGMPIPSGEGIQTASRIHSRPKSVK
jgi:hypothetical protein